MDHRRALEEIGEQALAVLRSSRLRLPGPSAPAGDGPGNRRAATGVPDAALPPLIVPVPLVRPRHHLG